MMIAVVMLVFTACSKNEAVKNEAVATFQKTKIQKSAESVKTEQLAESEETVKIAEYRDIIDIPNNTVEESLQYCGETTEYETEDGQFNFTRYSDFISVEKNGYSNHVHLRGEKFILTKDELWYINMDRRYTCFKYKEHDFSTESPADDNQITEVSDVWADDTDGITPTKFYFDYIKILCGNCAIPTLKGTLVLKENGCISLWRFRKEVDYTFVPFAIKEFAFKDSYKDESVQYIAVLENNSVIIITVDENIHQTVIYNGRKGIEVELLRPTEENKISQIYTSGNYVFFYVGGELHLANGEYDIIMDDVPWSETWIGDHNGPGKQVIRAGSFLSRTDVFGEEFDLEKEMTKTGINY